MVLSLNILSHWYQVFDQTVESYLSANSFTQNLMSTQFSRIISEFLLISFLLLLSYETIYWSGIYLNLWEYHAKDIFTEVPVHCAHVYISLNIIGEQDAGQLKQYYELKKSSTYNILNWKYLNDLGSKLFKLNRFVKYHFEFSPEDFENNPDPEYGSTVEHLRLKILALVRSSDLYRSYNTNNLTKENVLVYNNNNDKVDHDQDKNYLSKVHIETGNVIDCIVVL